MFSKLFQNFNKKKSNMNKVVTIKNGVDVSLSKDNKNNADMALSKDINTGRINNGIMIKNANKSSVDVKSNKETRMSKCNSVKYRPL